MILSLADIVADNIPYYEETLELPTDNEVSSISATISITLFKN